MKIIVAESSGFCFGVRRAVSLCERAAEKNPGCITLGPVIHNDRVISGLEARGVRAVSDISGIPPGSTVIIRSHGAAKKELEALSSMGVNIIDATCPDVRRIHDIVRGASAAGRLVVIIGQRMHPEIVAISGWCDRCEIFEDESELEMWLKSGKNASEPISLISQSTNSIDVYNSCVEIIKKECTNPEIFDTICAATRKRQQEAALLSKTADAMVVVGGKNSANSRRLADICRKNCPRVLFAESGEDIGCASFRSSDTVGVIAGASTPAWIIKEVTHKMSEEVSKEEARVDLAPGVLSPGLNGGPEEEVKSVTVEEPTEPEVAGALEAAGEPEAVLASEAALTSEAAGESEADLAPEAAEESEAALASEAAEEPEAAGEPEADLASEAAGESEAALEPEAAGEPEADLAPEAAGEPEAAAPEAAASPGEAAPPEEAAKPEEADQEDDDDASENAHLTESFEEMLEKSIKTLHTGEKVTGVVTSITATEVSVDLGTKQSGYIPISEFTDDVNTNIDDVIRIGDTIESFVMRVNDVEGMVMLSKRRLDAIKNWDIIEAAKESRTIVEGVVTEENKGGIVVNVKGVRVFVPASQTGLPKSSPMTELVRKPVKLRITEVNQSRRRVVGSIRAVQSDERRERTDRVWNDIEVGKQYNGVVKSMTSYGVFVDIGGVDGMIHISELSWIRIKQPSEIMSIGDEVSVYVLSFDKENRKISLGYKKSEDNPWARFTAKNAVGDVVNVKVVKMMPFGAFAEICPGVDGLIHISQITDHRIGLPSEVLTDGQQVDVKITEIDNDRKKVSLSIRALIEPSSQPLTDRQVADAAKADKTPVIVYDTDAPPSNMVAEPADEEPEEPDAV